MSIVDKKNIDFDVGIIGAGAMGSAAAYHLAKAGASVAAFDQYSVPHTLGSSHSESRLIRQAYFENPDYVPLLRRAYELWEELEDHPGHLFVKNGLFVAGEPDRMIMRGVQAAARLHNINIEILTAAEARNRFSGFNFSDNEICIFETNAGYLRVEDCVQVHLKKAAESGANIFENTTITSISRCTNGFEVHTTTRKYVVKKLVLAAGAWAASLAPERFKSKLVPHRVPLFWFPRKNDIDVTDTCFAYDLPEGFFYGFPQLSSEGIKIGLHKPGSRIENPSSFNRTVLNDERDPVKDFAGRKLPHLSPSIIKDATCIYTMTPDENFIIDEDDGLVVLAGFSGHGFKFATVVGEIARDLALEGKTRHPTEFLRYRW